MALALPNEEKYWYYPSNKSSCDGKHWDGPTTPANKTFITEWGAMRFDQSRTFGDSGSHPKVKTMRSSGSLGLRGRRRRRRWRAKEWWPQKIQMRREIPHPCPRADSLPEMLLPSTILSRSLSELSDVGLFDLLFFVMWVFLICSFCDVGLLIFSFSDVGLFDFPLKCLKSISIDGVDGFWFFLIR